MAEAQVWLNTKEAAAVLKRSRTTLRRYANDGRIKRRHDANGVEYLEEDVLDVADELREDEDELKSMDPQKALLRALQQSQSLVRQQQAQMLDLFEPAKVFAGLLRDEAKDMRARIRELEEDRVNYLKLQEKFESDATARDVARLEAAGTRERKARALNMIETQAIPLLFGADLKGQDALEAMALLKSFTPEQVELFLALDEDMVSAEQKERLRKVFHVSEEKSQQENAA